MGHAPASEATNRTIAAVSALSCLVHHAQRQRCGERVLGERRFHVLWLDSELLGERTGNGPCGFGGHGRDQVPWNDSGPQAPSCRLSRLPPSSPGADSLPPPVAATS